MVNIAIRILQARRLEQVQCLFDDAVCRYHAQALSADDMKWAAVMYATRVYDTPTAARRALSAIWTYIEGAAT